MARTKWGEFPIHNSEHWAFIICGLLVAFAVYFLLFHHQFLKPLQKRIEELESHFAR